MITITRYDPRRDKDALKELFEDFAENTCYFEAKWEKFEDELNKRSLDLKYRNAMVLAKEDDEIVGWGTFTVFKDYLGNDRALVHQVITKKEHSFKKGIEEAIFRELENYIAKTLKLEKVYYICPDNDGNKRSLLMKLNAKKDPFIWYVKEM